MSNLIITVGISASGKSTLARHMALTKGYCRINRDDLRKMLFGYTDSNLKDYYRNKYMYVKEERINIIINDMLVNLRGKDVILDNTHLRLKYIHDAMEKAKWNNFDFKIKLIEEDIEECIYRDSLREASVGEAILRKQLRNLEKLKKNPIFVEYLEKYGI